MSALIFEKQTIDLVDREGSSYSERVQSQPLPVTTLSQTLTRGIMLNLVQTGFRKSHAVYHSLHHPISVHICAYRRSSTKKGGAESDEHYTAVLGVSHLDDLDTIKKSFRALAKLHHPDAALNGGTGNAAKFASVLRAYGDACEEFDVNGSIGGGKLATAAEMFTVEEMEGMDAYSVRPFRLVLEEAGEA